MKSKLQKLKDRAWKLMSEYVRRRDKGKCFTCDTVKDWKLQNAGHFKHNKLDFDEMNINCQCVSCNKYKSGKLDVYFEKLVEKYGIDKVLRLIRLSNKPKKYTIMELEAIIVDLKNKISKLKNGESLQTALNLYCQIFNYLAYRVFNGMGAGQLLNGFPAPVIWEDSMDKVIDQIPLKFKKILKRLNAAEKRREERYRKKFKIISNGSPILETYISDNRQTFQL